MSEVKRERFFHPEGGVSLTKQGAVAATDINLIMEKWQKHGAAVAHLNRGQAMWGDFSSGVDYHEALNSIRGAQRDFAALPSKVRAHVDNDPGAFLEMVFDPERREELERLGLVASQKPVGADGDSPRDDESESAGVKPEEKVSEGVEPSKKE